MVKILFNGGNKGETYGKKRKRYPGTNGIMKNEVKQFNPVFGTGVYDAITFTNLTSPASESQGVFYAWTVVPLLNPAEGTEEANRIGNQYFLKYLRFKGRVSNNTYVPMDIHWRLVLYRCDSVTLTGWRGLYKNTENMPDSPSGYTINGICLHNFYKKVWDTDYSSTVKKKVIASGCMPKSPYFAFTGGQYQAGSQTSYGRIELYAHTFNSTHDSVSPLDVKVTCNDWITVNKIRYYLCLEVDAGSSFQDAGFGRLVPSQGTSASSLPLELNFFVRGYFTDP